MTLRKMIVFAVLAACSSSSTDADAAPAGPVRLPDDVAGKVELREFVRGLARPVAMVAAPDDPRKRLFVVEQHAGRIRIVENGKLLPKPFFVIKDISTGNEEGLLALAFHPKFADNGKLYVNYTAADMDSHVVEYRVSTTNPDAVDPTTARELIEIKQPYSNHNGGNLVFGPDGKLYAGFGDGGAANDPHKNGQNPNALLAKMLVFDVDTTPAKKPEILHIGLRNPWRYSFDVKTGGLYIGDVGQNLWEYVFVVPLDSTRRNFGWNIVEGSHCFEAKTCDKTGLTPPVAEYSHDVGCSVTGGSVYRGKALPMLDGVYFYADYCTGILRSFRWTADRSTPSAPGTIKDHWDWKQAMDKRGVLQQISSFAVDHDGELYIVELTGAIYKLVPKA